MAYKFDKQAEMKRKITQKDIEELKARGIDHWMFDEMEFDSNKFKAKST